MELLDRYLQAVRFWLPKTQRQDDLLAELGEDLRSQIEDKETELGRPLDPGEMSTILKKCGSPMMVAGRLGPQRHLIGPALFPIYEFVLKMVLLWILVPVFLFIVGPATVASSGSWSSGVLNTIGGLWSGLFIAAGIITLVFAIVERTNSRLGCELKWDPLKLPPVRLQERKPSLLKAVCEFGFGWFGLVWLLLVPHYPFLIFGPASAFLKASPMVHSFYLPLLLLSATGLLRSGITLTRPQWTWFPFLSQIAQSVLSLILVNYVIQAISRAHGAYPFVVLQDSIGESRKYLQLVAIVNVSIMLGVAGTWIGLCIATFAQAWQFMRYLRKQNSRATQPAQPRAA